MPIINIKLAKPMPDEEICEEIVADLTKYFEEKLGKKKERIVIMLEPIEPTHIAFGGKTVKKLNQK